MAQLPNNSISDLLSQNPADLIQYLLSSNSSSIQVRDAVFACLSQKPVRELIELVESSALFSKFLTLDNIIKSELIADMNVEEMLREMFSNFSNLREGIQNLIAVSALLVLVRIPTNEVSVADDKKIEELKALLKTTLFCDDIVIYFMIFRDEQQQRRNQCACRRNQRPCMNCNARFILSIGWYVAAQEAHDEKVNPFVENSNFLVVSAQEAHNIKAFVANSKIMV
jgi:hypothetical protein